MDDNLTYGMLMRRISVNDDMHILIPVHLISGMMIGDNVFADTLGKDYLVFTPGADLGDEIYFDEEYYIGK